MPANPFVVAVAAIVCGALITIFGPIARAYAKRMSGESRDRELGGGNPDIEARLARIEHAVESIAVEVERVSEGQRFTTKLLSEQRGRVPAGDDTR